MSKVAEEVAEEYASSLSDLTRNSKRLINLLTMLADENIMHAPIIVQAVEKHLQKVFLRFCLLLSHPEAWKLQNVNHD
jgi:pre-mRNA cleavage complex 2 protein Pcf11